MKRYFARLILFCSPFIAVILSYFILDPFEFVHKTNDFAPPMPASRDFNSTEIYIHCRNQFHYNSFIFGSSRTLAYRCYNWKNFIKDGRPFHFDASAESLTGISNKIKFIESKGDTIKNAIILLDRYVLDAGEMNKIYLIGHPAVTHQSWLQFHLACLKDYIHKGYFIKYIDYKIFKKIRPYMKGFIYDGTPRLKLTYPSNDFIVYGMDDDIKKDSLKHYKTVAKLKKRDSIIPENKPLISDNNLNIFKQIYLMLNKSGSNYKIIISPLYDQVPFNKQDLQTLITIFGKDNVFDFSGKNSITMVQGNYYEKSHYKPYVGTSIMKMVYNGDSSFFKRY